MLVLSEFDPHRLEKEDEADEQPRLNSGERWKGNAYPQTLSKCGVKVGRWNWWKPARAYYQF